MGRFSVEVELTNDADLVRAKDGSIRADQVRRERIRGVVDTGATRLVIPEAVAKRLGLDTPGTMQVRYADGRTAQRPIAERIRLRFGDRESVFNAVVEPARESALIGAIVLEDLDLIVDCTTQSLRPRDPKQIVSELE
jgi:clan AA aspartic protease